MKSAIEINGLGKQYLDYSVRKSRFRIPARSTEPATPDSGKFWALRDISFRVQPGEVVAVVGKNGSGKSTLFKILSRITVPTAGMAILRGRLSALLEVGAGFHGELSGRENIYLNGQILGMKRREIDKNVESIIQFAELEKFIDFPIKRYSTGMYLRLAFSVASHLEQDILLLDEVLAVGDAAFREKCLKKVRSLAQSGKTILLVSHSLEQVEMFCKRAVYLREGKLVMDGDVKSVLANYLSAA